MVAFVCEMCAGVPGRGAGVQLAAGARVHRAVASNALGGARAAEGEGLPAVHQGALLARSVRHRVVACAHGL